MKNSKIWQDCLPCVINSKFTIASPLLLVTTAWVCFYVSWQKPCNLGNGNEIVNLCIIFRPDSHSSVSKKSSVSGRFDFFQDSVNFDIREAKPVTCRLWMLFSKFHNMLIAWAIAPWPYHDVVKTHSRLKHCIEIFLTRSIFSKVSTWVTELWLRYFDLPRKVKVRTLIH